MPQAETPERDVSSMCLKHRSRLLCRAVDAEEYAARVQGAGSPSSPWVSPRGGLRGPAQSLYDGQEAPAQAALTRRSSAQHCAATTGRARRAQHAQAHQPLGRPRPHGEHSPHRVCLHQRVGAPPRASAGGACCLTRSRRGRLTRTWAGIQMQSRSGWMARWLPLPRKPLC